MPKWINLPPEPFYHQPTQLAFIEAKNERFCRKCRKSYLSKPPVVTCPVCLGKGVRNYDRLTIMAGRRFGKSKVGSIAGTEEASIPNTIGWACAPTNPKLHRYVIPAFQQLIPASWVQSWNAEFLDLRLKNGSLIHFQTLEDPDQGRGQGLDWLWIDEVCELTKEHWEVIRPSLAGDTVAFFTTTPRGYDWVYDELFHPAEEGLPGYWAAHARTMDSANPRISADFLAREKAQMSDTMYRQEYEADFVIFQGAVFGGSVDQQILRTDEAIRQVLPEWPAVRGERQMLVGIDTGADHPFGAVQLVVTERGLVVINEYLSHRENKTFLDHATHMKGMVYGHPNVKWGINKNDKQPMIELAQHGILCHPAQNEVVAGTERVKSWLQHRQLWFVESKCPRTITQMKSYRWADNYSPKDDAKKLKEKVYKKDDELPDALRYAVMTWPQLPKIAPPSLLRDISQMPEESQAAVTRLRRIEGLLDKRGPTESDAVQEFYS